MSIELAEVARKNSKQARLSAEKIFDAKREEVQNLKAEFDLEDKLWLKAKQVMQIKFKAIEEANCFNIALNEIKNKNGIKA